jgi:hypothetical protein
MRFLIIINYFLLLKIVAHQQKVLKLRLPRVKFFHSNRYQSFQGSIILAHLKLIANMILAKIILSFSQGKYKEAVKMEYKV